MPNIYGPAGYSSAELPDETSGRERDTRALTVGKSLDDNTWLTRVIFHKDYIKISRKSRPDSPYIHWTDKAIHKLTPASFKRLMLLITSRPYKVFTDYGLTIFHLEENR